MVQLIVTTWSIAADVIFNRIPFDIALGGSEAFLSEHVLLLTLIGNALAIILFTLMWRKIRLKLQKYENSKLTALSLTLTIALSIALNYFLVVFIGLTGIIDFFPSYEEIVIILSGGNLLIRVIAIGISAPIIEEILCRGIILNRLLAWMPKWPAIIISSALFGIVHFNLFQGLYAFAIGVVFAVLYLRYRNLWIPIIGHAAFNLANLLLVEVVDAFGLEINALLLLIPSVLVTVASTILIIKITKKAVLIPRQTVEPIAAPQGYYPPHFPPQV